MEEKKDNNKKRLSLKERWKDKRERAKIELMLYGIFFLIIIVFARISNSMSNNIPKEEDNKIFINEITDNYSYDIDITIDNDNYKYYGKVLGHNMNIHKVVDTEDEYFYKMNNKYYILDDNGNYILTNDKEIFSYIDYRYLDINTIKEYIKMGTLNNNIYTIKVSDILLNNNSNDVITITVDDINKELIIDYTNLFKVNNNNLYKELVRIKYSNIDSISSLDK